jgi:hypothetical protein
MGSPAVAVRTMSAEQIAGLAQSPRTTWQRQALSRRLTKLG